MTEPCSLAVRGTKSSVNSLPFSETHSMEETPVFYTPNNESTPVAEEQETSAEIYDELHNKLNWITVSWCTALN